MLTPKQPVRDVARATETGAATNIIYGLALGYQSAILPVIILSAIIFLALTTAVRSYTLNPTSYTHIPSRERGAERERARERVRSRPV